MAFGLAETAKLAVDLSLKGNFNSAIATSQKNLRGLNSAISDSGSRAFKAGQQIGTGIRRGAIIAAAAIGSVTALLIASAKEGQNAANVQKIYAQAVANSGKVTAANVKALNAQQAALLDLAGVDDELIKTEQTRLIQMGLTGDQVLKLTPAILDLSKATGIDLLTATKLAGKAAEGNTTALQRYGIMIDKTKAKTDPFGATLDALNKKFGGTTQALSGQLDTRLAVLRERLANVREEAGIRLLPALTKIVDVVGRNLVPAFNDFIQSILPGVISGLDQVANFLQSGGAVSAFKSIFATIRTAAPILEKTAQATFTIVKAAVDLFTSLPPEIQSLAVGAFAINKLTGGLVTNVVGGIAQFLAKSFTGNMNVTAANVNIVGGGIAGAAGAAAAGGSSLLALGLSGLIAAGIVAAAVPIGQAFASVLPDWLKGPGGAGKTQSQIAREAADAASRKGAVAGSPLLDRGGRETGTAGFFGVLTGTLRKLGETAFAPVKKLGTALQDFVNALKHATTDLERARAARAAIGIIGAGHGNLARTGETLAGLRKALSETHDPKLKAELKADIAHVVRVLPGREYAAKALAVASKALADGKLTAKESAALHRSMNDLKNRGLPHAAAAIQAKINAAKTAQVNAVKASQTAEVNAINAAKQATVNAIAAQSVNIALNAAFSLRQFGNTVTTQNNFTRSNATRQHP